MAAASPRRCRVRQSAAALGSKDAFLKDGKKKGKKEEEPGFSSVSRHRESNGSSAGCRCVSCLSCLPPPPPPSFCRQQKQSDLVK